MLSGAHHRGRGSISEVMTLSSADRCLLDYLPTLVVRDLAERAPGTKPPVITQLETVVLFGDVSGFTALSERLALSESAEGAGGEKLAFFLNSYFTQVVKLIAKSGGDIFKFAGDALLVMWPDDDHTTIQARVQLACQCAYQIQQHMHNAGLGPPGHEVRLSIKIGLGVGNVSVAHVGGVCDLYGQHHVECIAVGPPLIEAFQAEHCAKSGDVIVAPSVWKIVSENCIGQEIAGSGGFVKVTEVRRRVRNRAVKRGAEGIFAGIEAALSEKTAMLVAGSENIEGDGDGHNSGTSEITLAPTTRPSSKDASSALSKVLEDRRAMVVRRARRYVPRAVQPFLDDTYEFWGSEMRRVSVLFVNLGFVDEELSLILNNTFATRINRAFRCVQEAIYMYDGTINKFLVDDKGSTLIACFGLPPFSHENDAPRAVLASMALSSSLLLDGLQASVGITSSLVFCGVVGHHGGRREFTVLGDSVNLSARLMQHAMRHSAIVVCDWNVRYMSRHKIDFDELESIKVKGKSASQRIYSPKMNVDHGAQDMTRSGRVSSTFEMETVIDALALWREHVQTYAGSHSSINKTTANMLRAAIKQEELEINDDLDDGGVDRGESSGTENLGGAMKLRVKHVPAEINLSSDGLAEQNTVGTDSDSHRKDDHSQSPLQFILSKCVDHLTRSAANSSPRAILLEGQVGGGKTHILAQVAVACEELHDTLGRKTVIAVANNPFEKGILSRPYGVWQDVIEALLIAQEVRDAQEKILEAQSNWSLRSSKSMAGGDTQTASSMQTSPIFVSRDRKASIVQELTSDGRRRHRATTLRQMRVFKDIATQHRDELRQAASTEKDLIRNAAASNDSASTTEESTAFATGDLSSRERILIRWLKQTDHCQGKREDVEAERPDSDKNTSWDLSTGCAGILDLLFATNFVARKASDGEDLESGDQQNLEELLTPTELLPLRRSDSVEMENGRKGPRVRHRRDHSLTSANSTNSPSGVGRMAQMHVRRVSAFALKPGRADQQVKELSPSRSSKPPPPPPPRIEKNLVARLFADLLRAATSGLSSAAKEGQGEQEGEEGRSSTSPLVILIDDGIGLDNKAWEVAMTVANTVPSILLVVAVRPMIMHKRRFGTVPPSFQVFSSSSASVHVKIPSIPLDDDTIETIAKVTLGVRTMPPPLARLICHRAKGNPLFATEFARSLVDSGILCVHAETESVGCGRVKPRVWVAYEPEGDTCECADGKCGPVHFNLMHRRYICKGCGGSFSSECCNHLKLNLGYSKPVRHCLDCFSLGTREATAWSLKKSVSDMHDRRQCTASSRGGASFLKSSTPFLSSSPPTSSSTKLNSTGILDPFDQNKWFESFDRVFIHLPVPVTISCVLGMIIDSLTLQQQLMLKTAGMLGSPFRLDDILACFPGRQNEANASRANQSSNEGLLVSDLATMCELGYVRLVEPIYEAGSPLWRKQKYDFVVQFMAETITSRMLQSQRDSMNRCIADHREKREAQMRKQFLGASTITATTTRRLKSGWILVRTFGVEERDDDSVGVGIGTTDGRSSSDGVGTSGDVRRSSLANFLKRPMSATAKGAMLVGRHASALMHTVLSSDSNWKNRWVVIEAHHVMVYKDDTESNLKWKIQLRGATVEIMNPSIRLASQTNVIALNCEESFKKGYGTALTGPIKFWFSDEASTFWAHTLQYAIEVSESGTSSPGAGVY